ncbi:MAG: SIS domain-containing protein [Deltaproteobacteria bacterium]|nr:SIS domain-containing protein [Deltaproteobacteria bacterium]
MSFERVAVRFCRKIVRFFMDCKLHVGRDPRRIEAPALILFPHHPVTLCCGLAGILTLRVAGRVSYPSGRTPQSGISSLFARAAEKNLPAFLQGAIPSTAYLGGIPNQEAMDRELFRMKGEEAFGRIFYDDQEVHRLTLLSEKMGAFLADEERLLEAQAGRISTADLEAVNHGLVLLRDLIWGIEKDILDNIGRIRRLAGVERSAGVAPEALPKYRKMNFLLNGLDRLEVRGRDSAGIQISFVAADAGTLGGIVAGLRENGLGEEMERRMATGDLKDGSITGSEAVTGGHDAASCPPVTASDRAFSFTYKTAEIIGELGRNVRKLRKRITEDPLFHAFARLPAALETAFTHTRWASVGSITEENCHPIGNFTIPSGDSPAGVREKLENYGDMMPRRVPVSAEKHYPAYGSGYWNIHVVLNGDIDNYRTLRESLEAEGMSIAPEVTTDTKIIPLRIEKYLLAGRNLVEAFRRAVGDFEGSHAIAMTSNVEPGRIFLALKGSGQSIYIGITPDRYLFSSELYGLVEETPFFIKMDGEKPARPEKPETTGQIAILDQDAPGGAAGIRGFFYDGTPLPFGEDAVKRAEMTTRDIDRGDYPHYFLKEITESVLSVRKTLRGKYRIERDGGRERVVFNLGPDVVPEGIREALRDRQIRRIVVIGHGTAAVAGSAVADAMERCLKGSGIRVEARIASELSGFCLENDLHDTLIIPVTQSGTTTDTNRAVAMAAERGAKIIAIVNRRQSDITAKADGVFYTSDGRDIEMAVASTKAFYSQIVAGHILALDLALLLSTLPEERIIGELRLLERAPELMGKVLAKKKEIRSAVEKLAKRKRYWAVVGSGPNRAAAEEIRIKLSELCYQTISADVVENKKHIDLSAEPLILVCAAGSPETVMGDIVKDVAIFKAHKSTVIVFADEGEERFDAIADAVIRIPCAPLPLPVILNTVAGHLFGYYAACSIDADALFLREFKSRLNLIMVKQAKRRLSALESIADGRLRRLVNDFTDRFQRRRSEGAFSQTGVGTISDLVLLLKYTAGKLPIDDFRHDFPGIGAPVSPIDLLDITLGHAVDELSRPIDAIRHQAKTVTVGTSRKEMPPVGVLFDLLAELSFSAKFLLSTNVLVLRRMQKAVTAVNGYTLYAVNHLDAEGKPGDDATIEIRKRAGVSVGMRSRAEKSGLLMGTKKGIVASGRIYAGQGKSDGASVVIVPLLGEGDRVRNLLLIHVTFNEALSVRERKELLGGRANDIRDLIQEYNLPWDDRCLAEIPLGVLLGEPVEVIAGQIKRNLEAKSNGDMMPHRVPIRR